MTTYKGSGHWIESARGSNEVFVGNHLMRFDWPPNGMAELQTLRVGEKALDIHGNELAPDYCRPVFIDSSEYNRYCEIKSQIFQNASR